MFRCTVCFNIYAPSYLQCGQYCQMCKSCNDMMMENKVNGWERENKAMYRCLGCKQKKGISCFTDEQLTCHHSSFELRCKACEECKVYPNQSDSNIKENDIIPLIRDVSNLPLGPESHIGIKRKAEGRALTTQISILNVRLKRCMSCANLCSEKVCSSKEWKKSCGKLRCNVCLKLKSKAGRSDTNAARSDILDMHPAEEIQFPIANKSPSFPTIQSNSGIKGVVNPIVETLCNEVKRCSSCDNVKVVKSYTMKQWLLEGERQCTSCLRSVNKENTIDTTCNQPRIIQDRHLPGVMKRTVTDKDTPSGNMKPESRGDDVLISTIDPASEEDKQCSSCATFCSRELYTLNQWRPHHDGKRRCKACLQAGKTSRMFSPEVIDYFTQCAAPSPKKMQPKLGKHDTNSIFGTPCKPSLVKVLPPTFKKKESTNITTKKRDASINPSRKLESVHVQLEKDSLKQKTTFDACTVPSSIGAEPVKVKVEEDQWTAEVKRDTSINPSRKLESVHVQLEKEPLKRKTPLDTCTAANSIGIEPVKVKVEEDQWAAEVITPNANSSSLEVVSRTVYDENGNYKGYRSTFVEEITDAASVEFPCKAETWKRAVISTSTHICKKEDKPDDMVRFLPSHAQQNNQRVLSVLSVLSQPNSSLEDKPSDNLRTQRISKKSKIAMAWAQQDVLRERRKVRLDCSASTSSPPKKRSKLKIGSTSLPLKVSKNVGEIRSAAEISVMQLIIPEKTQNIGTQSMDPGTTKIVDHQVAGVSSNQATPVNPTKNRSTGDKNSFKEAQENVSKSSKNKVSLPSSSSGMPTSACSKYSDSSGIIQSTLSSKSSSPPQENDAAHSVETFTGGENNSEGQIFVVEKIIDDRQAGKQRKEYLIKWKGYPAKYNIWEYEHNILDPILIRRYVCRKTLQILKKRPDATDATTNIGRCVNALEFGIIEMDIDPAAPFDASKRTCPFCIETFDSHEKYCAHVSQHRHDDGYELLKGIAKLAPNKWYTSGVWI